MRTIQRLTKWCSLAIFLAARFAVADDLKKEERKAADPMTFVKTASALHLAEIQVGQLAGKRASRPDVKEYGQRLTNDHQKALDELRIVATKKNVRIATALDQEYQELVRRLAGLQGEEFEQEFLKAMVASHKYALQLFESQAGSGQDVDLKAYADRYVVVLRNHLRTAEELQMSKNTR